MKLRDKRKKKAKNKPLLYFWGCDCCCHVLNAMSSISAFYAPTVKLRIPLKCDNENKRRETVWFSPHCLNPAPTLFDGISQGYDQ